MREALQGARLKGIYDRVSGRYDFQHWLLTGGSDQRGRRTLVEHAVHEGDRVLDCGAGTGSTTLLALEQCGLSGQVVACDMSDGMLSVAAQRISQSEPRVSVGMCQADMTTLPFADAHFDVVLSTYSMCPLYDPTEGARELYRVAKPGGHIGVAHSTDPRRRVVRWLADRVESLVWHIPALSLGCRSVSVLPALRSLGCEVMYERHLGVPLWPFLVFVVRKPLGQR